LGKLSLIYLLGKVLEVAGKVLSITFKSGKAFKNSGKGFSQKLPKITLGKERERKAFSPSGNF
jgi:hypothetical protein